MIGFSAPEAGRPPHPTVPAPPEAGCGLAWRRVALACWAALIVVAFGVGAVLREAGTGDWALPVDRFPPLHASARLTVGPLLPAVAVAAIAVAVLPLAARRLPWRPLTVVAWLGSAVWAVVLALPDGIGRQLTTPTEYLAGLPAMGNDPLSWLRGFTRAMQTYPTHVKGHPPLPMLILWTAERVGLHGAGWAAALVITVGSSATAAIAVTVRLLAGADAARRAVPFLVLAPTATWVATSMDALFLGVAAWGVALVAAGAVRSAPLEGSSAAAGSRRPSALASVLAGGVLLGSLPYLSYGLLPILALPLAVLALTGPPRPVLIALAAGCLVVPAAFTLAGFSWWDGVVGTHAAWAAGAGSRRPYLYFLIGDLAVLALLIGPATARALPSALGRAAAHTAVYGPAGVTRLVPGRANRPTNSPGKASGGGRRIPHPDALGWLAAAALAGVMALDLSGVTRGEVERIWIPYAAWLPTAAAVYRAPARTALLAQTATALLIEALVGSPW